MSSGYETGTPLMEQTRAMQPHLQHLGEVASQSLASAPKEVYGDFVTSSVSADSGDSTEVANFAGDSRGSRVTVGSYKNGVANGQRETTVAISGDIPEIDTVRLTAAEATKIASSLKNSK